MKTYRKRPIWLLGLLLLAPALPTRAETPAAAAAAVPADARARIQTFLARYPALRVKIGSSPGSGHQQANLRLIQRLRELGYTGRIQVIYADTSAAKLGFLVPGFDPAQTTLQKINNPSLGSLELVAESQSAPVVKAEKMSFALSGASDDPWRVGSNEALNVDNFLQLQPRRWQNRDSQREIHFGNEEPVSLQHLWQLGANLRPDPPVTDWRAFLENTTAASPAAIREKIPNLSLLASAPGDFLPAYSIDYTNHPESILGEVLQGLKRAVAERPDLFSAPIRLPILTEFKTPAQRAAVAETCEKLGLKMISVKDAALPAALTAQKPGEILAVEVGELPPKAFEAIFRKATLPALLEGKNLSNAMVDAGLPFLNILGSTDDIAPEMFGPQASPAARDAIKDAFDAFSRNRFKNPMYESVNNKAVADYFTAAKDPASGVGNFFRSLRARPDALETDLVARSLLELEAQVRGREQGTITPKPMRTASSALPCVQGYGRIGRGGGRAYSP